MSRSFLVHIAPAALLLLAGCATYAPQPLATAIADADPAVLSRDARTIDRPYLTPAAIDLAAPLDDNALAVLAVLNNPDLKALRSKAGVADAQVFAARLLPDPTFSIGASPVLSGPDPVAEIAGALGFDLDALRTGKVRRAQAEAQAKQVRLDIAWAEWQTAGQARLQAVRIRRLRQQVSLLEIGQRGAQSLLDRTLRAAARGDLSNDPLLAARAAELTARDQLTTAQHDLAAAELELRHLLGLPPDTPLSLAPSHDSGAAIDSAHLLQVALANRADLQALRAGYDAQEAAVHKAVLDQFPGLALNFGVTRDTSKNLIAGPSVDLTLPLWNRNRGGIAVERATRAQLKAEYDARLFQTRADIAAAVSAIALARRQRDAIRADLPHYEQAAQASRRAADRGDVSIATAEAAEGVLGDKEVALSAADQSIDEAMIALELLTGVPREDWR
jgi:outer membrane protein TolC